MTKEEIKKLFLIFASADSIGISYKNYFINDIFIKKEMFMKEELISKGCCKFETPPYTFSDNIDIIVIFLEHFINNKFDIEENNLILNLNYWYDKYDPFNLDGALRMKMFSNIVNFDNSSSFFLSRIIFPLLLLKYNNYLNLTIEDIKKRIYFISRFSNKDKAFLKYFHLIFDLLNKQYENFDLLNKQYDKEIKELLEVKELYNDDLTSTLHILFKYLMIENKSIDEIFKELIILNINPELILPLYVFLHYIYKSDQINLNLENHLNKKNIEYLNLIIDKIYDKIHFLKEEYEKEIYESKKNSGKSI